MEIEIERVFYYNVLHFGAVFMEMIDEAHLGTSQCKAPSQLSSGVTKKE
jgi:hypothetical protein